MAQWREVSMTEAVIFIQEECGQPLDHRPPWAEVAGFPPSRRTLPDFQWFDNGVAVACVSDWDGPFGEIDEDVDCGYPQWFIYS